MVVLLTCSSNSNNEQYLDLSKIYISPKWNYLIQISRASSHNFQWHFIFLWLKSYDYELSRTRVKIRLIVIWILHFTSLYIFLFFYNHTILSESHWLNLSSIYVQGMTMYGESPRITTFNSPPKKKYFCLNVPTLAQYMQMPWNNSFFLIPLREARFYDDVS